MHQTIRLFVAVAITGSLSLGSGTALAGGNCCATAQKTTAASAGVGKEKTSDTTLGHPTVKKPVPAKTLLFFLNPNGRPCQMQEEIINDIRDSINASASLTWYKTSEAGHRQAFGKYGIRGLPSLIIIDDNGRELHRFTPGIQSGEAILSALRKR